MTHTEQRIQEIVEELDGLAADIADMELQLERNPDPCDWFYKCRFNLKMCRAQRDRLERERMEEKRRANEAALQADALVIGWNGGHTAVTLPDGTPVSSGEGGGVRIGGGGAFQRQFTRHMHLPMAAGEDLPADLPLDGPLDAPMAPPAGPADIPAPELPAPVVIEAANFAPAPEAPAPAPEAPAPAPEGPEMPV